MSTPALGALRTPADLIALAPRYAPRDITVPATLDLRGKLRPVRNQGSQGACVAFASACVLEYFMRIDGTTVFMSPQYIYNRRSNNGSGMHVYDAVKILTSYGAPPEREYSYGTVEAASAINDNITQSAMRFRITSGASVRTVGALKSALVNNGPCVFALPVYNRGARFWIQNAGDNFIGGHAVAVVGYTKTGFIIRNSWGDGYNNNGHTELPFADFVHVWETWTMISAPPYPNIPNDDAKWHPDRDDGCCKCDGCIIM